MQLPTATVTIVLYKDNQFHQDIQFTNGKTFSADGKWEFEAATGRPEVTLDSAYLIHDGFGNAISSPNRGIWSMPCERSGMKIRLWVSFDNELYFLQVLDRPPTRP